VQFIDEHMRPLSMGGGNAMDNRALVCKPCAMRKTVAEAAPRAKANRQRAACCGLARKKTKTRMPGAKDSGWKRRLGPNGPEWVRRVQVRVVEDDD
jgi:hypothetical protein